jgi:DNA modification methylase
MQVKRLTEIRPNPENPRVIRDEKFKKLVNSLRDFPEMAKVRPVVVNTDMVVLGGNMRLRAMKEAGWKEVPVEVVDWSEEKQREFIVKDNVGFGEWDWDELANTWDAEDLNDWGLDTPDNWGGEELEAEEDDYQEPDSLQVDVILGDLIEIGEHRLLCGDSTDSDQVAKLMNGEKAELLFTSPPYSDMREYNGEKDLSVDNLAEFIPTWAPFVEYQVVNLGIQRKDNDIVQYWDSYIDKAKKCGNKLLSWNTWVKPNASSLGQQTAMFPINIEFLFVFGNSFKELNRTIPCEQAGKEYTRQQRGKDGVINKGGKHKRNEFKKLHSAIFSNQETKPFGNHPAPFPVELPSEYIKAITNENQVISEPFTGSGTTMVAAHQLKRKCYGMELDPKYCQVIIDRMQKLDPTLSVKINGKEYVKTTVEQ